jgi:vacuolar-type H+-ATPase subunit I/STV1
MDAEQFKAIQVLAMDAVVNPTYDSFYRNVCRWFSEKFNTPLMDVEDMAPEYVFQHYWEDQFQAIKMGESGDQKLEEIKAEILATEEEIKEAEAGEDDWIRQLEQEVKGIAKAVESATEAQNDPNLINDALPKEVNMIVDDLPPLDDEE